jgi:hypothetical protein
VQRAVERSGMSSVAFLPTVIAGSTDDVLGGNASVTD